MKVALTLNYDLSEGFFGMYLSGLREGKAVAGHCNACGRVAFPPEAMCICGARGFALRNLSGEASVLWRTSGQDGEVALVRFDGSDTLSVARLEGFSDEMRGALRAASDGALVIVPGGEV